MVPSCGIGQLARSIMYNNVLGEGHGTGVLTNHTINTWSDCHQ